MPVEGRRAGGTLLLERDQDEVVVAATDIACHPAGSVFRVLHGAHLQRGSLGLTKGYPPMVTAHDLTLATRCVALVMTTALGVSLGCGSSGGSGSGSGCDAYFQAVVLSGCNGGPVPPQSEISRIQSLFETVCANEEALPGSGVTDSALSACASAVQAAGCGADADELTACQFTGTLAAGAACSDEDECESGSCSMSIVMPGTEPACGKCTKAAAIGQPCGMTGVSCVPGSACDASGLMGGTCKAITYGVAGDACDTTPSQQCGPGLFCRVTLVNGTEAGKCTALGGMGVSCESSSQCQSPLGCPEGKCAPRSAAGGPCLSDSDCAGLACDGATNKCASVTWVSAGGACGPLELCLVGECPTQGKCPTVLKDGQACVETSMTAVCDTLSTCVNGKCELAGSTVCH